MAPPPSPPNSPRLRRSPPRAAGASAASTLRRRRSIPPWRPRLLLLRHAPRLVNTSFRLRFFPPRSLRLPHLLRPRRRRQRALHLSLPPLSSLRRRPLRPLLLAPAGSPSLASVSNPDPSPGRGGGGRGQLSYRDMPVPVRPGASAAFPGNAVQKNAVTKKDLARKSIK